MRWKRWGIVVVAVFLSLGRSNTQEALALLMPSEKIPTESVSLSCDEAYDRADNASEKLASSADRLRQCAEDVDADGDGCSRETKRVLADQSVFQKAMSGVKKECN